MGVVTMVYITAIMEQHPVPQDITGFKFKLVGDMTLKQFGELAAGAILAYIFYASSWNPFFKWPFVILFGSLGIALAFLPIEERPLDLWIINFLKAIYRPTIFVWKKNPVGEILNLDSNNLTTKPTIQKPVAQILPIDQIDLGPSWPYPQKDEKTKPPPEEPATLALSIDQLANLRQEKLSELEEAKKKLQEVTKQAKEETFQTQVGSSAVTVDQLADLRQEKLAQQDQQPRSIATSVPGVRVMDKMKQNQPTISLSNQPNIISGMVVTDKGGPIEGVVILIKDKAGNSIRALKTNTLGQFVVATPMENGTYYVELEKPHYSFKVLEVTLSGQVLAPLEIPATLI